MLALALFAAFLVLFVLGTPVAVALGLAGTLAIYLADLNVLATPTSAYTGIAKYPLLRRADVVLVGAIFDRSGVALRLVNFTQGADRPQSRLARRRHGWSSRCSSAASRAPDPANAAAVGRAP